MKILRHGLLGLNVVIVAYLLLVSRAFAGVLEFSHPSDGSVVAPGNSISVNISTDETMKMVTLFSSSNHLVISEGASKNDFIVNVSPVTPLGCYQLKVAAFDGQNKIVKKININVEIDGQPSSLKADESIFFTGKGQEIPINLVGYFNDNNEVWLARSSKTKYKSENAKVATVSDRGIVNSIGPGGTYITISYDGVNISVPVKVMLNDGDVPLYKVVSSQNGYVQTDQFGNYIVNLKIINNSNTSMWDISLNRVSLNSTNAIAIVPTTFTNTDPNTSEDVKLTFPPSAGIPKSTAVLQLKGSYVANLLNGQKSQPGALSSSLRISLP